MAYRECELGLMVKLFPDDASTRIMDAYRQTDGNTTHAAELLGVNRATLKRWVAKLSLRKAVEKLRDPEAA